VVSTVIATDMRRLGRDRIAMLFVAVMPFVLILAIGSFIPSDDVEVVLAVVDHDGGPAAVQLTDRLESTPGFELVEDLDMREAERDMRIRQVSALVVFPDGFSEDVGAGGATLGVVVDPQGVDSAVVMSEVAAAIDQEAMLVTVERQLAGAGVADAAAGAEAVADSLQQSEVAVTTVGRESGGTNLAFVTAGQMLLFMFLNSLAAGMGFIELRRLGILDRIRSGPTDSRVVLLGLGISRFGVVVALAIAISVMAVVIYDVDWGPPGVLMVVIPLFAIISAAASALLGALVDEPERAIGVGVPVGLAMAALGGCMFPTFLAPEGFQVASKVLTPHAWALDAILRAAYDGDTVVDIIPNIVVLVAWAVAMTVVASLVLRRRTG
jgi:ABC-2 type transport system permease protein